MANGRMTLQEIGDRLEIQDLLARYSFAIDDRDWEALDSIFTADARIDYTQTGGAVGSLAQVKAWLPLALERFSRFQHLVATSTLDLAGDRASGRTILFNPMVYRGADGVEQTFFIGLWYRDVFVRTTDGWRIAERVEEMSWSHNVPDMPPIPPLAA
ncbi:nuclear transport factor 2 family protein [Sphingomonas sp. RP10(2022)]|uniref:Nuclear transport factor 2 family protein n=1 Tax=Sphingomonas liriopis TaxID=2949094 RepID=A0A9X2HRL3_9SPHN|nr:nuclear transport factor 2 family protein [Sphingomonas liriopis]MCP3735908.1 nuclear transport factor 2 family protein [Sphingomonas liriopis]